MLQTKTLLRSKVLWTICGLTKMPYFGSKKRTCPKKAMRKIKLPFAVLGCCHAFAAASQNES